VNTGQFIFGVMDSLQLSTSVVSTIPEQRTVEFPKKRSLGELYLVDADGKTHPHGDAQGTVEVPAGKQLALYYNFDPAYGCSLLKDLNPNGLFSVSFLGSEISDNDLAHVGRLTGLKELDVSCTQIGDSGMPYLKELKELKKLNLASTRVCLGLKHLGGLPLQELTLDDTDIGDDALAHIAQLRALKILSLSFTKITDRGLTKIKEMKSLEKLRLNCTDIGDDGLAFVGRLTGLRELWVRSTHVSYPGLVELTKWLLNCEIII